VRAIGRWSLAALVVNSIIGSGIFLLPTTIARLLGRLSPWAVLLAGLAVGVIIACFAEVASRFNEGGGPYLYARRAFGRFVGIETGWFFWLARITAPAANANLAVIYLGEFWPHAGQPLPRFTIITALIAVLALVNLIGVRAGTQVSNVFTVAKLGPLVVVALAGAWYVLAGHQAAAVPVPAPGAATWLKAVLLMVFAYGGFETALTPMGEARNPQRDAAFALFFALALCILLYTAIQFAVVYALPDPAHAARPLADLARLIFGPAGAALTAIGALLSVYGYLSANMLAVPRITFALAEQGDFPRIFSAVHRQYHTPYFSILVFALLTWLLALLGSFDWNLTLSAVARLFYYGLVCAALPVLRRREPRGAHFVLPGGMYLAILGVGICIVLGTRVDLSGSLILIATVIVALLNWLWVRRRSAELSS